MNIVIAIIIFSLIILFHELGHFLFAKRAGIRVNEFCLGMGPTLVGKKWGETKYSIKLLPFGGACVMEGEDGESKDERAFHNKSVWARISVVIGGPLFNFILAFLFALILIGLSGYDKPVISDVMDGFPAQEAGLTSEDSIVSMNGQKIHFYREVTLYSFFHPGETVKMVYERDGRKYTATLVPKYVKEDDRFYLGLYGGDTQTKGNVLQVIQYGGYEMKYWLDITVQSLRMLFTGKVGIQDLSGPVGIVKNIGDTYNQSKSGGAYSIFLSMLNIAIFLSVNLGVMNLLPLPALDGGRLIFLLIEVVRRKRMDPNKEGMVHFVGLILLMALMVFVMFNDIRHLLPGG